MLFRSSSRTRSHHRRRGRDLELLSVRQFKRYGIKHQTMSHIGDGPDVYDLFLAPPATSIVSYSLSSVSSEGTTIDCAGTSPIGNGADVFAAGLSATSPGMTMTLTHRS